MMGGPGCCGQYCLGVARYRPGIAGGQSTRGRWWFPPLAPGRAGGDTPPQYQYQYRLAAVPHTAEEKKRVVARLRRIKGQAEALERAVLASTECGALLQQLSALRGAANGLMAEVLESHLRETFGVAASGRKAAAAADTQVEIERLVRLVRSYLK